MGDTTTINVFFLLFGALQGLLLGFIVWQKKKNLANALLAGIILLATLQIFHKVVSKTWLMDHLQGAYKVGYELPFLFGPLLLAYIIAALNPAFHLKWKHLLHLIPFLWFAILRLLYIYVFPFNDLLFELLPYTTSRTVAHGGIQMLSLWAYTYLALKALNEASINRFTKWLKQFIFAFLGIETMLIVVLKLMVIFYGLYPDIRLAFLSLTLLIYWMTYQVLKTSALEVKNSNGTPVKKYANSSLRAEDAQKIIVRLEALLEKEQLFLKPDLKIETIAKTLNISRHHLSQAINTGKNCSYYELINSYRIKAAQHILKDKSQMHLTIAAIAYDTGFQSISNFNALFKKHTRLTPSQYRRKKQQDRSKISKKSLPDRSDR